MHACEAVGVVLSKLVVSRVDVVCPRVYAMHVPVGH